MICKGHMALKNVSYKDACNFFNFLWIIMKFGIWLEWSIEKLLVFSKICSDQWFLCNCLILRYGWVQCKKGVVAGWKRGCNPLKSCFYVLIQSIAPIPGVIHIPLVITYTPNIISFKLTIFSILQSCNLDSLQSGWPSSRRHSFLLCRCFLGCWRIGMEGNSWPRWNV